MQRVLTRLAATRKDFLDRGARERPIRELDKLAAAIQNAQILVELGAHPDEAGFRASLIQLLDPNINGGWRRRTPKW